MARPLRIDFPGARHHVMSRGPRRQLLFCDEDDFAAYLDLLGPVVERYAIRVFGYALMPSHSHLLVESTHGNLSRAMAHLNSSYAHHVHRRVGPGVMREVKRILKEVSRDISKNEFEGIEDYLS